MLGEDYFKIRAQLGTALLGFGTLAHDLQAEPATIRTIGELSAGLREPFLFVVVGEVKAGKSSLLNALFGREVSRVDVLPATDKIYIFKYGEEDRTIPVSPQLSECYRALPFLQNFNIVDTPGTNTIVAEHEAVTRQFLPLADLCLCVFSATNPWGETAWQFLQHIHKKWLKKVVLVVQQCDLRSPTEIAAILTHVEQTMLQKIGERCAVFPVSAKRAWEAKQLPEGAESRQMLEESGFARLEQFIIEHITGGVSGREKLLSTCKSGQVILDDLGGKVRSASQTLARDLRKLDEIRNSLAEREDQSLRQIGGMLWTLDQSFERAQKRGEELLRDKLTLGGTLKLIFGRGGWEKSFQAELEARQRESLTRHITDALELVQTDLRSVWKQMHELLQRAFAEQAATPSLPDFDRQRRELIERIELSILEKSDGAAFEEQMTRLFSETAIWLRVPAGVLAAGGIATVVAAALTKLTILDITGSIAAIGALTGTVIAFSRRKKIIAGFRKQTTERREAMLRAIEDHLRHALNLFYQEIEQTYQPLKAFTTGQRRSIEPLLNRIREMEDTLGKCAAALGG
jgi:small GTP-binding protein